VQRPLAVARDSFTPSSGPAAAGTSERRACVMSTSPTPGTGTAVVGIGIGASAGTSSVRLTTSPVAPAVCWPGWPAGPSSAVRADMTLACSGMGSAGRLPPELAALHVAAPTLAVTGAPAG
jgi:hypothetical protein